MSSRALLAAVDLTRRFDRQGVEALRGVTLRVGEGETVGIVGESGCGKSTLAKVITGLVPPSTGHVEFRGVPLLRMDRPQRREFRRQVQLVFQNPGASLNPRHRVADLVGEGLRIHRRVGERALAAEVDRLLREVSLPGEVRDAYPHELSGGERQRVAIARALAVEPQLLICDEAVSSLDLSVQAQILNLLWDLKEQRRLSYVFISHDLSVIRHLSDRVLVMYLGKVVEAGPAARVFENPGHPYTRALLSSIPEVAGSAFSRRIELLGEVSSSSLSDSGCGFAARCPVREDRCHTDPPPRQSPAEGHDFDCIHSSS